MQRPAVHEHLVHLLPGRLSLRPHPTFICPSHISVTPPAPPPLPSLLSQTCFQARQGPQHTPLWPTPSRPAGLLRWRHTSAPCGLTKELLCPKGKGRVCASPSSSTGMDAPDTLIRHEQRRLVSQRGPGREEGANQDRGRVRCTLILQHLPTPQYLVWKAGPQQPEVTSGTQGSNQGPPWWL